MPYFYVILRSVCKLFFLDILGHFFTLRVFFIFRSLLGYLKILFFLGLKVIQIPALIIILFIIPITERFMRRCHSKETLASVLYAVPRRCASIWWTIVLLLQRRTSTSFDKLTVALLEGSVTGQPLSTCYTYRVMHIIFLSAHWPTAHIVLRIVSFHILNEENRKKKLH